MMMFIDPCLSILYLMAKVLVLFILIDLSYYVSRVLNGNIFICLCNLIYGKTNFHHRGYLIGIILILCYGMLQKRVLFSDLDFSVLAF